MPSRQPDMKDVYDLVELNQRLEDDARRVTSEEKRRFVELADQALEQRWARTVMGGEEIEESIRFNRNKFAKYLAA